MTSKRMHTRHVSLSLSLSLFFSKPPHPHPPPPSSSPPPPPPPPQSPPPPPRGSTPQTRTPVGRRQNTATSLVHTYRADQWASCKAPRSPTPRRRRLRVRRRLPRRRQRRQRRRRRRVPREVAVHVAFERQTLKPVFHLTQVIGYGFETRRLSAAGSNSFSVHSPAATAAARDASPGGDGPGDDEGLRPCSH